MSSLSLSIAHFLRPSETWLSLFSEMKDARHGASKQKCRQSQTNLQMKNIKGAAPIVSLSCPGKIGSLRAKNDIVYINRGPWLDATMFVRLCCPPSLLPLPTGHFSLPPAQSFLWRLSLRDKERKNGKTKKKKPREGEIDKHDHNCQHIEKDMIGPFSWSLSLF